MKRLLTLVVFAFLIGCSENKEPQVVPTNKLDWGGITGGWIDEYQRGHVTYLIFHKASSEGGICVVNYTQDSLEWEFLHQPTKTTDYGPDKSQTEQAEQPVRSVRTSANN